jgi:uncharacterized protein YecE (DUF72 family)
VSRILIGTSGWQYPHWRARFYPRGMPSALRLQHIASVFDTVEINGTFHTLGRPDEFARWRASVPDGFVFSVKGSRYLTHMLKLTRPRIPLANFFAQGVLALGKKLGPIVWQLPPMVAFDVDRAGAFFALLPRNLEEAERLAQEHDSRFEGSSLLCAPDGHGHRLRYALEVRHDSWLGEEALQLLAKHDIALVTADSARQHPASLERTANFAYLRLHGARRLYGGHYSDADLDEWGALVAAWAQRSDVYVYFDNDERAYAPADAQRLRTRLSSSIALGA